jgi:CubicO group peptidase (beta-lactamase class C family)
MTRITLWCFFLMLAALGGRSALAQQTDDGLDYDRLAAYIDQAVQDYKLPGLSIAIVKDDQIVFERGFGKRKLGKTSRKGKVDPETVFAIASQSKAYTATALAMLVDEGKLAWDDFVTDHLSGFRLHDPAATSMLRVSDLLCHRVGLNTFDGDLLWYGTDYSREEVLRRIRHLPLQKPFRASYGYQNVMFLAAGQIVEEVSGQSWDSFVARRIFAPLGMNRSSTRKRELVRADNVARPHLEGKAQPFLNYNNIGPAASINSSAADIAQWMRFWLNEGVAGGDTLLAPGLIKEMLEVHNPLPLSSLDQLAGTHFKGYGYGWFLMDYAGRKVAHHGGGLPGYISKVMLVPEEELGMVVLSNGMSSLPTALMYRVLDFYFEAGDRDWAADFLRFSQKNEKRKQAERQARRDRRVSGTEPTFAPDDYTGNYRDPYYGTATVELRDRKLKLVLEPADSLFQATLEHWHYDTYRFQFADAFLPPGYVTFETDEEAKVSGFTIELKNPDFHFYNLEFERVGK